VARVGAWFFIWRNSPPVGQGLLIHEVSRSPSTMLHSPKTPLDEWLARRRDIYLTTHNRTTDIHPCPRWDSNQQSQQASGADLRLRRRGHCDRQGRGL